jgi:hypothetical protein
MRATQVEQDSVQPIARAAARTGDCANQQSIYETNWVARIRGP